MRKKIDKGVSTENVSLSPPKICLREIFAEWQMRGMTCHEYTNVGGRLIK